MIRKEPKPKKCKQCLVSFIPKYGSLQVCCQISCAVLFNSEKEVKKRINVMKVESQKLSDLEAIARTPFQKWIRLRDQKHGCISCGKMVALQFDGGHYAKAEIYSGLIFEPTNVHKQCSYCNDQLSANLLEYRKGLIDRYGFPYLESLEDKMITGRNYKYSRDELIQIANLYKLKIKNKDY